MEISHEVVNKLLEKSAFRNTKGLNKRKPCWILEKEIYYVNEFDFDLDEYYKKYIDLSDMNAAKQLAIDLNKNGNYPIGYCHDFSENKTWNILVINNEESYQLAYLCLYNQADEKEDVYQSVLVSDLKDMEYTQNLNLRYGFVVI